MVAACRFRDGAVMIADTRATWLAGGLTLFQDSFQKILPLAQQVAIGFAGDVQAAELIVRQLRRRMQTQPRLRILRKLAADVPRLANHYYALPSTELGPVGVTL
jgi:20S proteasome alpha/beta subunit